ncbi:MAG TPA: nitroreductase/quinone reductase family protein [Nevskiaceae bacterium]|nr:nitroreductase/quinone reductase family protein [Nevskiaceae bacterium]
MKLPHVAFRIINPLMTLMLRSPLHGAMSASVLVLSYTGRRSGRTFTLPLRYAVSGDGWVCFTSDDAKWWRNFEEPRPVSVVVRGATVAGVATTQRVAAGESLDELRSFLTQFPQDATYHDVAVSGGVPSEADLQRATARAIRLRIRPG